MRSVRELFHGQKCGDGLRRGREPRPVDASGRCELKTRPCPGSKINSPWRLALYGHRGVGI